MGASFADRFRFHRLKRSHSQEEAGAACGVHKNSVNGWESGRRFPTALKRMGVAEYLGMSLEELDALLLQEKTDAAS